MSKNLLTKFRKFWRTLSPLEQKRLYNIFTALRGEDDGREDVKYRTTARIRGLLFGEKLRGKGVRGFFRTEPSKMSDEQALNLINKMGGHFCCHIRDAIRALAPYVPKKKFSDLPKFLW